MGEKSKRGPVVKRFVAQPQVDIIPLRVRRRDPPNEEREGDGRGKGGGDWKVGNGGSGGGTG